MPFTTPFSTKVINAPRQGKVKVLNLELYDGTIDLEEHLGCTKPKCMSKMDGAPFSQENEEGPKSLERSNVSSKVQAMAQILENSHGDASGLNR